MTRLAVLTALLSAASFYSVFAYPLADYDLQSGPKEAVYDRRDAGLKWHVSNKDLLNGVQGTVVKGGFHEASKPEDAAGRIATLTDGVWSSDGLTVVAGDIPFDDSAQGPYSLQIEYSFNEAKNISEILVFSGHEGDGARGWINCDVDIDRGFGYDGLIAEWKTGDYGQECPKCSTVSALRLYDDAGYAIAENVQRIRFKFWAVSHNTTSFFQPYYERTSERAKNYPNQGTVLKEIDVFGADSIAADLRGKSDAERLFEEQKYAGAKPLYEKVLESAPAGALDDIESPWAGVEYRYLVCKLNLGEATEREIRKMTVYEVFCESKAPADREAIAAVYPRSDPALVLLRESQVYYLKGMKNRAFQLFWQVVGDYPQTDAGLDAACRIVSSYVTNYHRLQTLYGEEEKLFKASNDTEGLGHLSRRKEALRAVVAQEVERLEGCLVNNVKSYKAVYLMNGLAQCYGDVGKRDRRAKVYELCLPEAHDKRIRLNVLKNLAAIYEEQNLLNEAIKTLRMIVEEYPEEESAVSAQERIVAIYRDKWKLVDKAIEEERLLKEKFGDSQAALIAQFNIGKYYYEAKEPKKAIYELLRFMEATTDEEQKNVARLLIGLSYVQLQENDKARNTFKEFLSGSPNSAKAPQAQFLLGYTYIVEMKYDEARMEFEKLIRLYPKSNEVRQAKDLLAKLSALDAENVKK
jgi:TolA-binding protein